jgi:hypothetical protein
LKDIQRLIFKIDEALDAIEIRIEAVKRQRVTNVGLIFSFKTGLIELREKLIENKKIELNFIEKWNLHMAHVSRFFEADPLGDLIFEIDNLAFQK